MGYELKGNPDVNVDELVKAAGQKGFFFESGTTKDYGEILRLYQIGKSLKEGYQLQYKNTYVREKELKSNMKHAGLLLGLYAGLIVLDLLVVYLFGQMPGFRNTIRGFLSFTHYALMFLIAIGAVLVAVPFTMNLLKQIYLYRMLTNPTEKLDDDREKFHVITLNDERKFLKEKMKEYNRLFGALDRLDENCKGVFYTAENKAKADSIMETITKQDLDAMHKFSNIEEFRAKSIAGKESISAWWILVGAMIPLAIALGAIASGISQTSLPGFM
jgi:hypothetical protein